MRRHLEQGNITIHPFVSAELALGSLTKRSRVLALLDRLPPMKLAHLSEVRAMIEARRLYGFGIGLIDAHLIASVLVSPPTLLWTRDRHLRGVAETLGIHCSLN